MQVMPLSNVALRHEHVRALFAILGEASELAGDAEAQERHALARLGSVLHAAIVLHIDVADFRAGGRGTVTRSVDLGWRTDSERRVVLGFYEHHGTLADPLAGRMAARYAAGLGSTHRREDLIDDSSWYGGAFFLDVGRAAGVDHALYSIRPAGSGDRVAGLGVTRAAGDRAFDDYEVAFAHLFFHDLMPQLRRAPRADARRPRLSPRERDTLDGLLAGLSEKEIAARLGLSIHTVHHYVKSLYRRFRVTSRSELLARHVARTR